MSKIVFWSPLHGQGQTSNLHAMAFIMSLLYKKKVLIMQTHILKNNLEGPLVGTNVGKHKSEYNEFFQDIGLDAAVTYSLMNQLTPYMLESCCITFPETSLLLLPGTETKNKETFERDIGKSVSKLVNDADKCVDLVLIDVNSGNDKLSVRLMETADLIVINLTQRRYVLDNYFSEYGNLLFNNNKKAFYLLGLYDDNSTYNINNCRVKYGKHIRKENSGVVPYCTKYLDAQNKCDVIDFFKDGLKNNINNNIDSPFFILKNMFSRGKYDPEETYYFFHRSILSAKKMLRMIGMPVRMDEERSIR